MGLSKENEMIVILSPQGWGHQFISKHHYAVEFSKLYKTVFVSPTLCQFGKLSYASEKIDKDNSNLLIAQLTLPFPNWFRFKFNKLYRIINRIALNYFFKKRLNQQIRLIVDFGCHKSIDRVDKFQSLVSTYFPVDDFIDLPIETRSAAKIFTVSSKIQEKFEQSNIPITWINHGLSSVFAEKSKAKLLELERTTEILKPERKKVGYSGNLTIPFLDREVVLHTIKTLPEMEFHFFGNYSSDDYTTTEFINMLKQLNNVQLHGQLSTENLAEQLFHMDILWLCYKSDGKNYNLENSHKILEYLSTGKPIVSTPIKYLENADKDFIYQYDNKQHADLFEELINGKEGSSSMIGRVEFALSSTYSENMKILLK